VIQSRIKFSRPIVAVLITSEICLAKLVHKIRNEFILRFLSQHYAKQCEIRRRFGLPRVVDESEIASETKIEVLQRKRQSFPLSSPSIFNV
jgi:hypothetical protein